MVLSRLFKPRAQKVAAQALYASAVEAARREPFYRVLRAPDTREGRFELYSLHVFLLLDRLKGQGEAAHETSQYLGEAMIAGLDDAFYELGVSHVGVPKKVKKLGQAFLGRVKAYDDAFNAEADGALSAAIERMFGESPEFRPAELANYARRARTQLAAQPLDALLAGTVEWARP